jgi:hypothetical protein
MINLLPFDGRADYYGQVLGAEEAERRFLFRHRESRATIEVLLAAGSLLVMRGTTQTHWLHSLPKMKKVRTPRVNLTFRTMMRK